MLQATPSARPAAPPAAAPAARPDALAQRCETLVAAFRRIASTRMAGLPLLNPVLQVQAIGFALLPWQAADAGQATDGGPPEAPQALGVLLTPWFMNLVCLPLARQDRPVSNGQVQRRVLGGQGFDFTLAHEPSIGSFAACSLYSPVFEFRDMEAACGVAKAVLAVLQPAPAPVVPAGPAAAPPGGRRSFLLGRRAGAGA